MAILAWIGGFHATRHRPCRQDPSVPLIEAALAGEDVVIARGDKPVVRLVPIEPAGFMIGLLAGQLGAGPDFLDPMGSGELDLWETGQR